MVNATFEIFKFKCFGNPDDGNGVGIFAIPSIPRLLVSLQRNQQQQVLVVRLQNLFER